MTTINRRRFLAMATGATLASVMPGVAGVLPILDSLSPVMAARIRAMRDALAALGEATDPLQDDVVRHARECVEAAFTTPISCADDEDAVILALDAYEEIHSSAFSMQTARDLFTPRAHQTYPRDRLRHWLLTDPDEDFVKTGMPGFLRVARQQHMEAGIR